MTLGESIRKRRLDMGLTQKQLGELCHIAESAIRRYESDRVSPKLETLGIIAGALNTNCKSLLADTNDTKRALLTPCDFIVHSEEAGDILIEVQHTTRQFGNRAALYDFLNRTTFTEQEYAQILAFAQNLTNTEN